MIEEVVAYIIRTYPEAGRIGILSTNGVYQTRIYQNILEKNGLTVMLPEPEMQNNLVHRSIYDPNYGIKACANPVTQKVKENLTAVIDFLQSRGTEIIILGCTELCLAITEATVKNMVILDSTTILARALIAEAAPDKLKER